MFHRQLEHLLITADEFIDLLHGRITNGRAVYLQYAIANVQIRKINIDPGGKRYIKQRLERFIWGISSLDGWFFRGRMLPIWRPTALFRHRGQPKEEVTEQAVPNFVYFS